MSLMTSRALRMSFGSTTALALGVPAVAADLDPAIRPWVGRTVHVSPDGTVFYVTTNDAKIGVWKVRLDGTQAKRIAARTIW